MTISVYCIRNNDQVRCMLLSSSKMNICKLFDVSQIVIETVSWLNYE